MDAATTELRFVASRRSGEVSALLLRPADAEWLLVLAHGAGAGMRHSFMEAIAERLAARRIATFRYQFPYTESGSRRPSPKPILLATVRSAVNAATLAAADLPLLAGGKSMGGRMTSLAASETPLPGVRGLVFFAFPLHPAGKPSTERALHLEHLTIPLLFLQGSRDRLADLERLRPVCERLGAPATLRVFEEADHSFHVPKRTGKTDVQVLEEIGESVSCWTLALPSQS